VSKLQLMLASLVAAVPGGFLSFLMVKNIFDHSGKMETAINAMCWAILAPTGLITVLPIAILIFVKGGDTATEEDVSTSADEPADDFAAETFGDDEVEEDGFAQEEYSDVDIDGQIAEDLELSDDLDFDDDLEVSAMDDDDIFDDDDEDDFV